MHNKNATILWITFLGLFLVSSALNAYTLREQFEKTVRFNSGGELILENTNGSVSVESWDKDEVRIESEKVVKAGSRRKAEKIMEDVRIDIERGEDYLEIKTRLPRRGSGFWDWIFGEAGNIHVEYRLYVPKNLKLDTNTVNGRVHIAEVGGQIRIKSTNGRIKAYRVEGSVNAKTTNGGIEVEFADFDEDEDMSFKTTNGDIKVIFPKDLRAYVDASTTNGRIKTDFPIEVRGELSKRKLRGQINGGGARIDLHTTNGSITILQR